MFLNSFDLQKLVDGEIVEIRGISGKPATVAQAKHAPTCVQVHAMSGLTFNVLYNATIDQFKLTRREQGGGGGVWGTTLHNNPWG